MRALIAVFGSAGDVLPFVAIGRELLRRGHSVALLANPYFASAAESAGLELCPIGRREDHQAFMDDEGLYDWREGIARNAEGLMRHFLPSYGPFCDAIVDLHEPGRTVLISTGPWALREKCDIPTVVAAISPYRVVSRFDPPHPPRPLPSWAGFLAGRPAGLRLLWTLRAGRDALASRSARVAADHAARVQRLIGAEVDRVRARHGLAPALRQTLRPPIAVLGLWPDWFASPQRDWPPSMVATGFPIDPGLSAAAVPPMGAEEARRPVVFTTGSLAGGQKRFHAAAAEACRLLGRPGVLVTPHAEDVPAVLPPGVTYMAVAPFDALFAGASAVVHHGGIGTTALALAAGVPQVARPFVGEQFDIANRMRRLGVGTTIGDGDLVGDRLARTIDRLLRSDRVRERCRQVQARLWAPGNGGLNRAADVIEEAGARACPRLFESRRVAS